MRFAYSNLADAATLTASSEIAGYPVENVLDPRLTVKWHSDSATAQSVVIDLGSAATCKVFAIVGHNINSGATVRAQGNATDAWTSPSVNELITYNSGMMIKYATGGSYRYWRFSFSGLTSGLEIGRLWIGDYIQLTNSSFTDFVVTEKRDDVVAYGNGRQKYASRGDGWRAINLNFPKSDTTTTSAIRSMFSSAGKHASIIFCNFDSLRDYPLVEPMYCSITNDIEFSHADAMRFRYSLSLEEDL